VSCANVDTTDDDPEETTEATDAPETPADVDTVAVELGEWSVLPDEDSIVAGEVTFEVSNTGEHPHEFVIVKSDLDPGKLPLADDGSADEEQVDLIDEVEELEPGDEGEVEVELDAGNYILLCNLVETHEDMADMEPEVHYELGMRTPFEVS
jgi:uncharacterized cupredoxin-like copper-binding protein